MSSESRLIHQTNFNKLLRKVSSSNVCLFHPCPHHPKYISKPLMFSESLKNEHCPKMGSVGSLIHSQNLKADFEKGLTHSNAC